MKHKSWWGVDNRGQACSELLLYEDGSSIVHGRLTDGSFIEYAISSTDEMKRKLEAVGLEPDPYIGRQLCNGVHDRNWVKAKVMMNLPSTIDSYTSHNSPGFSTSHFRVHGKLLRESKLFFCR